MKCSPGSVGPGLLTNVAGNFGANIQFLSFQIVTTSTRIFTRIKFENAPLEETFKMSYKVEKVLLENEDLIVEKLDTSDNLAYDELLRTSDNEKSKKKKKDLSRFSKKEDFIIRALDLLSPYDTDFIHNHFAFRTKSEIEYRLNDPHFRLGAADFKKVPSFMFELIFLRNRVVASRSLMLLTQKQVELPLILKYFYSWFCF